jgi:heterodisulfide reductase subunit B
MYVYFYSLHASGNHLPIIRGINLSIRRPVYVSSKLAHQTVIYTEWHTPEVVLIQLILLMMGTWLPAVSSKPAHQTVIYTEWHIPDVILIQLILLMMGTWLPAVSSKPAHQTIIYTEWHIPDVVLIQLILLMMGTWLPETCSENRNKHTWKRIVNQVGYLQNYTKMHGQQNVKFWK